MADSTLMHGIPRTLDDPPRFLWWDMDQATLVSLFVVFGMLAGSLASGVVVGGTIGWSYGKLKSGKHKAFAIHAVYWHLPGQVLGMRRTPTSDYREYIG